MTSPLGPAGINAGAWPFLRSAHGHGDTTIAELQGLDKDTVIARYKEKFIGEAGSGTSVFTSNSGPLAQVFAGLPDIPGAPLLVRVVAAIGGRLLGVDPATLVPSGTPEEQMQAVLHVLQKVPILGDLIEAITGIEDGDLNDLGTKMLEIRTNVESVIAALQGIDLSNPGAVLAAIGAQLGGKFADLLLAVQANYTGDDLALQGINDTFAFIMQIFGKFGEFADAVAGLFGHGSLDDFLTAVGAGPGAVWALVVDMFLSALAGGKGLLSGLIDISWLTDQHQNLIVESGYDAPVTVGAEDDPQITHDATDGVGTPLGCLRVAADGANHERVGELVPVGKGWELAVSSAVKRESVVGSAGSVRVELQPYLVVGDSATPVGSRSVVCSVASPSGSAGWATISGSWTVPGDGSVTHVVVIPRVTAGVTAGVVKFDDTSMFATQNIPQAFVKNLAADLNALMNWIQSLVDTVLTRLGLSPVGSLMDRIHDLGDELQIIQSQGADALAGLATKLGLTAFNSHLAQLLSNPGALLGQLGMGQTTGLSTAINELNQIRDLLAGLVVTPINSTVQAIKDALGLQKTNTTTNSANISSLTNALATAPATVVGSINSVLVEGSHTVQHLLDALNFFGGSGTIASVSQSTTQTAITAQAAAAAAAAAQAQLAQQQAQENAGIGAGMSRALGFSGPDGAGLPSADWNPYNTNILLRGPVGYMGINSVRADGSYYTACLYAYSTNNQSIEVVLGDQGGLVTAPLYVIFHSAPSFSGGACLEITYTGVRVGHLSGGGVFTQFTGGSWSGALNQGSRVGCRNVGTVFTLTIDGKPAATCTDSSGLVILANKYVGVFMSRKTVTSGGWFTGYSNTTYDCFRIASIAMSDYVIPTYVGSGARITSTSTGVSLGSSFTAGVAPSNTFTAISESTSDIAIDLTNAKFTVGISGWYHVKVAYVCTGVATNKVTGYGWTALRDICPTLYKNGTEHRRGQWHVAYTCFGDDNGSGTNTQDCNTIGDPFGDSWIVYLSVGDYLRPGVRVRSANASWGVGGEPSGTAAHFEIALINRSQL